MTRSTNPNTFLTYEESARLAAAVDEAERKTCAEIKVVMVRHCWTDIQSRAARIFRKLGLDKTEQRNCVMILMVLANREFLIYGDQGIHEKVGQAFWDDVRSRMSGAFRSGNFVEGLTEAVQLVGARLAEYFPQKEGDRDEISDEVAFEE